MIDKETWKIGTDLDEVEKLINTTCLYKIIKSIFLEKKTFLSNIKQSAVFFYES